MRVLVTGGSRGIGREVARDFAAAGDRVWLAATTPQVHVAARELGADVRSSVADVASAGAVAALFAEIADAWDGVDAVVHAAAILGPSGAFWELDDAAFRDVLAVDVLGAFSVAKAFVRLRSARPSPARGKIVLFAGGGAGYGYPWFVPYGTAKAAVVRMCETMAMELDARGVPVDVNVIAPGANETDMLAAVRAAGGEVRTTVPFSKPVALCRWLASPGSDGVSGRFLHVNDDYAGLDSQALRPDAYTLRRIDA
jgi:3-oxoacyl-[acyl-carrier protein] reductase